MDKEKILAKSRAEKHDEGLENAINQGSRFGYKVFTILTIIIIVFNLFTNQEINSVLSIFWGFIAADAYYRFKFTQSNSNKIAMIAASLASIIYLINHIYRSLV